MKFQVLSRALILLSVMAFCFAPSWATAEPTVTAISGKIEDGRPIIIYGHSLGDVGGPEAVPGESLEQATRRIELGNSAVYEDCTLREVQMPVQWRDKEVVINLNLSPFQEGDSIYLFVVDENNVASPGYVLEVVRAVDPGAPGMPGQPFRTR